MKSSRIGRLLRGGLLYFCGVAILTASVAAYPPEGPSDNPKASVGELFEAGKMLARARQKPCKPACTTDQICVRGRCVQAGPPGSQCEPACTPAELCVGPIGERSCCRRDKLCKGICYSGPVPRCQGEHCCPFGETCCGSSLCCKTGERCCEGQGCCRPGQTCCAGACCNLGETCLRNSVFRDDPYPCCPNDQVCGEACCGPNRECVEGVCRLKCVPACEPGQICVPVPDFEMGTPRSCCPIEDAWDLILQGVWINSVCCPPELRWVHTQGYIEQPECCPLEDRWVRPWRDTSVGECCPKARRCGEKCCPPQLSLCENGVCKTETPGPKWAPWLQPDPACKPRRATIHISALTTDMSTGQAICIREVAICGDRIKQEKVFNSRRGEKCPWAEGGTAAFSRQSAEVCCKKWNDAKRTKLPCNPLADADCDGTPNDEDPDPLTPGGR